MSPSLKNIEKFRSIKCRFQYNLYLCSENSLEKRVQFYKNSLEKRVQFYKNSLEKRAQFYKNSLEKRVQNNITNCKYVI